MKTKLSSTDLIALVRIQHTINDMLFYKPSSDYTDYDRHLMVILKAIDDFFITCVYSGENALAYHVKVQSVFDRLVKSPSYEDFRLTLDKLFNPNK